METESFLYPNTAKKDRYCDTMSCDIFDFRIATVNLVVPPVCYIFTSTISSDLIGVLDLEVFNDSSRSQQNVMSVLRGASFTYVRGN